MIVKRNQEPKTTANGMHTFLGAFCQYKKECAVHGARNWNDDTIDQYENIIRGKIVPLLTGHDTRPISDFTKEDYLNVIHALRKQGKNKKGEPIEAYDEDTLQKYLHIIKTVVHVASEKDCFPDVFSDPVPGDTVETTDIIRSKSFSRVMKSFTVVQERAVVDYLFSAISNVGEAIALYLMFALGLRNGESCAVRFSDVKPFADYPGCYYLEIPQTTIIHSNKLKVGGKSFNTGRRIPLHSSAHSLILRLQEERMKMLTKTPYAGSDIGNLSMAYRKGNPLSRCSADDVTAAARKMFSDLGLHQALYYISRQLQQDYAAAEEECADDEFVLVEKDPTAYVFRRNFFTTMAILGLSESETKYVMGHVIEDPQTARRDFSDERLLYSIKLKMDKRRFPSEPAAMDQAVPLPLGTTTVFHDYTQQFAVPEGSTRVQLSVVAKEPNEAITVHLTSKEKVHSEVSIYSHPLPERYDRTVNVMKAYHESRSEQKKLKHT